jgi:hypothetical protein
VTGTSEVGTSSTSARPAVFTTGEVTTSVARVEAPCDADKSVHGTDDER